MPTAPPTACYCGRVQCDHARQRRQRKDARRGSATSRGYTWQWHRAAVEFLGRYPLCGMRGHGLAPVMSRCADTGRITAATLVDHVVPHRQNWSLFWDESNWQSLCAECHTAKTLAGL